MAPQSLDLPAASTADWPPAFASQRRRLWGLAYRLTGSSADADDVVQETFVRWLERFPGEPPAGPWLVRVATRLGIDTLRARRRRTYVGTWLPAPVVRSDDDWIDTYAASGPDPEARYGLLESATLAFLVALEALHPRPRAVLLLRDVLGYSAAATADVVGTSEGNVRVLHLRARKALASYDQARAVPDAALRTRHRAALATLLRALVDQDLRTLETLLTEDVRTTTDGGGEFTALAVPLVGRARVARFYLRAALNRAAGGVGTELCLVNGLPAAILTLARPVRRQAPLTVMTLSVTPDGRIDEIRTVLAAPKLARLYGAAGM